MVLLSCQVFEIFIPQMTVGFTSIRASNFHTVPPGLDRDSLDIS